MLISDIGCNEMLDALTLLINANPGPGIIEIRTGPEPDETTDADTGDLLATLTFSASSFLAAVDRVATANSITSDPSIDMGGVAAHFRIKDSSDVVIIQGTVAETGDSGDIVLIETTLVQGEVLQMSSMSLTLPATSEC